MSYDLDWRSAINIAKEISGNVSTSKELLFVDKVINLIDEDKRHQFVNDLIRLLDSLTDQLIINHLVITYFCDLPNDSYHLNNLFMILKDKYEFVLDINDDINHNIGKKIMKVCKKLNQTLLLVRVFDKENQYFIVLPNYRKYIIVMNPDCYSLNIVLAKL